MFVQYFRASLGYSEKTEETFYRKISLSRHQISPPKIKEQKSLIYCGLVYFQAIPMQLRRKRPNIHRRESQCIPIDERAQWKKQDRALQKDGGIDEVSDRLM